MLKKMSIILLAVLLMVMVVTPVFAENPSTEVEKTPEQTVTDPDGGTGAKKDIETKVEGAMDIALSIAQTIGVTVAVILLIVVAIKYMAAAPSDKAEIKKHMVVYVIGAVLLLSAAGVLQIIKTLGDDIIGDEASSSISGPGLTITH